MRKKIITILTILIFSLFFVFSIIISITNPRYKNVAFFIKMLSSSYSEITIFISHLFGGRIVYSMIIVFVFVVALLPSYSKILSNFVSFVKSLKPLLLLLLTGNTQDDKESDLNLELENKYERNYKRAIEYYKIKKYSMKPILWFCIHPVILSFVGIGIISLPKQVGEFDYSFLWIKDVFLPDDLMTILYIVIVVLNIIKMIYTKSIKKSIVLSIITIIIYSTVIIAGLRSSFVFLTATIFQILYVVKKIFQGGKKYAKKKH